MYLVVLAYIYGQPTGGRVEDDWEIDPTPGLTTPQADSQFEPSVRARQRRRSNG